MVIGDELGDVLVEFVAEFGVVFGSLLNSGIVGSIYQPTKKKELQQQQQQDNQVLDTVLTLQAVNGEGRRGRNRTLFAPVERERERNEGNVQYRNTAIE